MDKLQSVKIPFSAQSVTNHLGFYLHRSSALADLPELRPAHLPAAEVFPLGMFFQKYSLNPIARRYLENLYTSARRTQLLEILLGLAENYPIEMLAKQAFALYVHLVDSSTVWSNNAFICRLAANSYWEAVVVSQSAFPGGGQH